MPEHAEDQQKIRQYLLGDLSEEVRQQVEERLLTENSFLDELLLGEEELIDDYVSDDLPVDDRLRFEQHFLSTPERQQKLRFALALSRYTSTSTEKADSKSAKAEHSKSPNALTWTERLRAFWKGQTLALRTAEALVLIAIIVGAIWLAFIRTPPPRTFATLTLSIGDSNRSGGNRGASKVPFPINADALRISLMLPEQIPPALHYRVELLNDDGEITKLKVAGQDAQSVLVVVPASQLERRQYALRLFAIKEDGTEQRIPGNYFFIVE